MTKRQRSDWFDLAVKYRELRYPKYNLQVSNYFKYDGPVNRILLETFIKRDDRLMYVSDWFEPIGQFNLDMIREALKKFQEHCELVDKEGIFNTRTTIKEPKKKVIDLNNFNTFKKY